MSTLTAFRDEVVRRLRGDLIGPITDDEILSDRPSERYVTGILFPQGEPLPQEEDDALPEGGEDDVPGEGATAPESVSLGYVVRPSSIAVSVAVEHDGPPAINIEVRGARYEAFWNDGDTAQYASNARWRRLRKVANVLTPAFKEDGVVEVPLDEHGIEKMSLRLRWSRTGGKSRSILTVALVNDARVEREKVANQQNAFFQAELLLRPASSTTFVERPSRRAGEAAELRLLYRDAKEYAVGHGCSADWEMQDAVVTEIRSCWIPAQIVSSVSAEGQNVCQPLLKTTFSAKWLASASVEDLARELRRLPDLYTEWLAAQKLEPGVDPVLAKQAEEHLRGCAEAATRMRGSIDLLCDPKKDGHARALAAFRFAMLAMNKQRRWAKDEDLYWRPFQIGFQLLALESLARTNHPDRALMDLLWFPTGGGKTEAYFGLIAFVLFHRRLRNEGKPEFGGGTAVLMRYTLRLLTIQQFQRATRLICACEWLRRRELEQTKGAKLGETPFSIGLWVGGGATPNTIEEARPTIARDENPTARQITSCPACGSPLRWGIYARKGDKEHVRVKCEAKSCELFAQDEGHLPVWTVDEDVYAKRPSLVIGTVDKFTQIVRKPAQTSKLFGRDENEPPDLILQDELHLISGPLGSLAGIYEMAIDELCIRRDASDAITHRPKIIGSTATIRAADAQVKALFARDARQFPPSELRAEEGFFTRRATEEERPGRLYVGMTSAGRSPKFALQALYASLLQSGRAIATAAPADRDPWWTLVGYFNSLRELGGALVMLSDDVPVSVGIFARARGESADREREVNRVDELTSRKSQIELRDTLADLERQGYPSDEAFDAVLATNMISVGVDVDRLGVMAVTNQPKQMAEYIQATSRVGRQHPGLVVTLYNNNRARDRSHYESFRSWHQALYRDVEATSVTPLAPPARDKAVHAAIIALATTRIHGLASRPRLTKDRRKEIEAGIVKRLVARAEIVDASELSGFVDDVTRILDRWESRCQKWESEGRFDQNAADPPAYWMDSDDERSLLMSAEVEAAHRAAGQLLQDVFPTLNSLRNVEASAPYKLLEKIRIGENEVEDAG